jgi:hypothetical protein
MFEETEQNIGKIIEKINDSRDTEKSNLLRLSLGEVKTYLNILKIIFERYEEASRLCHENFKQQQALFQAQTGEGLMTDEQMELWHKGVELHTKLRLEIESFYLFGHIALAKITNFPQRYFCHDNLRGLVCGSHEKFWNSMVKAKQFSSLPESLVKLASWLTDKVVHYRDKLITHTLHAEHDKRLLIKGFGYSLENGGSKMSSMVLYPKVESPEQVETEDMTVLIEKFNKYFIEFTQFLLENIDKSVLNS